MVFWSGSKINCCAMVLHYIFVWVFMTITQSKYHLKTWATTGRQIRLKDSLPVSQVIYYSKLITKITFIILIYITSSAIFQEGYHSWVWYAYFMSFIEIFFCFFFLMGSPWFWTKQEKISLAKYSEIFLRLSKQDLNNST